jgi:Polyketide cyclase / dehydrase and lipid transport
MPKFVIILAVVLLVVLGLAGFVATRPDTYKVERSRTLDAPPEVAFGQVVDFHKWDAWSPWAKLDPNMKTTHEGEAGAVGSSYLWQGNDKVGRGKMTLVEVNPPGILKIKLEFLEPYPSTSETVFTFKAAENGTHATWTMNGKNNFVGKAFCLVMNMDQMIGADFEKGLAQLNTVAAAEAKKVAEAKQLAEAAAEKAAEAAAAAAAALPPGSPTGSTAAAAPVQ